MVYVEILLRVTRGLVSKETILNQFRLYSSNGEGIAGWLTEDADVEVFNRLDNIDD